jgi:hypothetical protein
MKTVTTITRTFDERDNCIEEVKVYEEFKEEAVEPKKEVVESEYFTGKIQCVMPQLGMTKGKVYSVDNGQFFDDDETLRPVTGYRTFVQCMLEQGTVIEYPGNQS